MINMAKKSIMVLLTIVLTTFYSAKSVEPVEKKKALWRLMSLYS